jgi:hypothetical protein
VFAAASALRPRYGSDTPCNEDKMTLPDENSLSAEEQAYFDTKGEGAPAAEPEPEAVEPDEEIEADVEDAAPEEPKAAKTVPLAALTKTREETKALKAQLEEQRTRNAIWEDRWNTLLRQQQPAEEKRDADPEPDPNVDIFAHQQWLGRQLKAEREARARQEQEAAQHQEMQRVEQQVWNAWEQDAATYVADNADFPNAAKWLSDFRDAQLKALGKVDERFADARARNMQIEQELKQIVIGAKQRGLSSAQVIYELAQGYGYTPKAPAADPADALDRLEKSVAGATSLSASGGARPAAGMDAAAIANMSPEQFGAWLAKNGERGFKKLAGG